MRDIAVLLFTIGSAYFGIVRPWLGVLALAVFAYLNPHRYAWGFSRSLPVFFIVFIATCFGMQMTNDRQQFPWTRETILFLSLLAWFIMTSYLMPDFPWAAKDHLVKVMKVIVGIFPMFWLINTPKKLKALVITIAISFGLIGFKGGIFAFSTGFSYRVWGPDATFYGGNNEIAVIFNMMLPLLLLCVQETKKLKFLFYAMFFFNACSVISSWSRGGLVTLIAVTGGLLYRSKRKWLLAPLIAVVVVAALPNLPQKWHDRMNTIQTYEEDASAMGRIDAWGYAWRRALQSPLTGGGFQTFLYREHDVHSAYFEILGEHGFVALGMWLFLLFGTMAMLSRLRKTAMFVPGMEWIKPYSEALQISIGAYAVGSAFLGTAYWEIFYQLIGISALMKIFLIREIAKQKLEGDLVH